MRIGIGLPNTLGIAGERIVEWARRAEERGFTCLATIDRIVYPTFDSLTTLGVAAGATSRIGLLTDILLGPLYPPVWLAKASASLDSMSGGRLTLGLAVGGRPDDFQAMGTPMRLRGKLMDEALDLMQRAWSGEPVTGDDFPICPPPANGHDVPILIGGTSDAALRRAIRYGEGWTAGGSTPDQLEAMAAKVGRAWHEAGRDGEPRIAALAYFGLGDNEASKAVLRRYYGFLGQWANTIADNALHTPNAVQATAKTFASAGVTDLVFVPTVADVAEVDRLADAVL